MLVENHFPAKENFWILFLLKSVLIWRLRDQLRTKQVTVWLVVYPVGRYPNEAKWSIRGSENTNWKNARRRRPNQRQAQFIKFGMSRWRRKGWNATLCRYSKSGGEKLPFEFVNSTSVEVKRQRRFSIFNYELWFWNFWLDEVILEVFPKAQFWQTLRCFDVCACLVSLRVDHSSSQRFFHPAQKLWIRNN